MKYNKLMDILALFHILHSATGSNNYEYKRKQEREERGTLMYHRGSEQHESRERPNFNLLESRPQLKHFCNHPDVGSVLVQSVSLPKYRNLPTVAQRGGGRKNRRRLVAYDFVPILPPYDDDNLEEMVVKFHDVPMDLEQQGQAHLDPPHLVEEVLTHYTENSGTKNSDTDAPMGLEYQTDVENEQQSHPIEKIALHADEGNIKDFTIELEEKGHRESHQDNEKEYQQYFAAKEKIASCTEDDMPANDDENVDLISKSSQSPIVAKRYQGDITTEGRSQVSFDASEVKEGDGDEDNSTTTEIRRNDESNMAKQNNLNSKEIIVNDFLEIKVIPGGNMGIDGLEEKVLVDINSNHQVDEKNERNGIRFKDDKSVKIADESKDKPLPSAAVSSISTFSKEGENTKEVIVNDFSEIEVIPGGNMGIDGLEEKVLVDINSNHQVDEKNERNGIRFKDDKSVKIADESKDKPLPSAAVSSISTFSKEGEELSQPTNETEVVVNTVKGAIDNMTLVIEETNSEEDEYEGTSVSTSFLNSIEKDMPIRNGKSNVETRWFKEIEEISSDGTDEDIIDSVIPDIIVNEPESVGEKMLIDSNVDDKGRISPEFDVEDGNKLTGSQLGNLDSKTYDVSDEVKESHIAVLNGEKMNSIVQDTCPTGSINGDKAQLKGTNIIQTEGNINKDMLSNMLFLAEDATTKVQSKTTDIIQTEVDIETNFSADVPPLVANLSNIERNDSKINNQSVDEQITPDKMQNSEQESTIVKKNEIYPELNTDDRIISSDSFDDELLQNIHQSREKETSDSEKNNNLNDLFLDGDLFETVDPPDGLDILPDSSFQQGLISKGTQMLMMSVAKATNQVKKSMSEILITAQNQWENKILRQGRSNVNSGKTGTALNMPKEKKNIIVRTFGPFRNILLQLGFGEDTEGKEVIEEMKKMAREFDEMKKRSETRNNLHSVIPQNVPESSKPKPFSSYQ